MQRLCVNGEFSALSGVREGSVLGSILIMLATNKYSVCNNSSVIRYFDLTFR